MWHIFLRRINTPQAYFSPAPDKRIPINDILQLHRRMKKDIESLPAGQLEKIVALQGVTFRMKSDPPKRKKNLALLPGMSKQCSLSW
jgi:hypothetical protein